MILGHKLVLLAINPKPESMTMKYMPVEVTVLNESKTVDIQGAEYTIDEIKERFQFLHGETIMETA